MCSTMLILWRRPCLAMILVAALLALASPCSAAEWFASPDGQSQNAGTRESPWDIVSALGGGQKVAAGDTVSLLGGTYKQRPKGEFEVRLVGTAERPIHVRPAPGERATIDGGLYVHEPSAHVWIRDLEILVSENFSMSRELNEPGSHPESYNRPWGGLNTYGGAGCKYINLVIHDCAQGISSWVGAKDIEIYGCLIYENGWKGPDRGHGHCIYTQNQEGTKTIRHCIMSAKYPGSATMHAYGSERAYVDNYLIRENIAYGGGRFLVGGGRPSRNIRALDNVLDTVDLQLGYSAPHNENCEVRGNVIVGGALNIVRYKAAVSEDNLILASHDKLPEETLVRWFPNDYDPRRAHLAVFTREKQDTATINAAPFLTPGDRYRLMDPKDLYGKPIHEAICDGKTITIPTGDVFRAFVVFKDASSGTR